MKLSIDTKEDSFEDIRKVLQILSSMLEKKDSSLATGSALGSALSGSDTTSLMSMFSEDAPKGTVETKGAAPDFSSFLNLAAQKTEKRNLDNPKIELY